MDTSPPKLVKKSRSKAAMVDTIKLVDLFAGVGGFHYGVNSSASESGLKVKPILVSEIDKNGQETYQNNFSCPFDLHGDINTIELPPKNETADILTAGFPCQPFSNSGRKMGLSDPRGQFYQRIEGIIKYFNSKTFILENVPGIITNGGGSYNSDLSLYPQKIGQTMKFLEENLQKLTNYSIKWLELDSSYFGCPQVRKRVFIVGIHKDFEDNLILDFKEKSKENFITVAEETVQPYLELSPTQEKNLRSFMKNPPSFKDGMRRFGKAYLCPGGNVGQGYHAYGLVPTLTKVWARFLPIYFPHPKETLPDISKREFKPNKYYGKGYIRKVSVREAYRLQGFPESFKPHKNTNIAYEQAGNAVNVNVVKAIVNQLLVKLRG